MITNGRSRILPPHRMAEFQSPEDLEIARTGHPQQCTFIPGAAIRTADRRPVADHLTPERFDGPFTIACSSEDPLDRCPKTDPVSHDLAGACQRSVNRAHLARKMDPKTADSRRMTRLAEIPGR